MGLEKLKSIYSVDTPVRTNPSGRHSFSNVILTKYSSTRWGMHKSNHPGDHSQLDINGTPLQTIPGGRHSSKIITISSNPKGRHTFSGITIIDSISDGRHTSSGTTTVDSISDGRHTSSGIIPLKYFKKRWGIHGPSHPGNHSQFDIDGGPLLSISDGRHLSSDISPLSSVATGRHSSNITITPSVATGRHSSNITITPSVATGRHASSDIVIENKSGLKFLRIVEDVKRIGKWVASPKGILWNAEQAGLQVSNAMLTSRNYLAPGLLANIATSPIGTHVARHIPVVKYETTEKAADRLKILTSTLIDISKTYSRSIPLWTSPAGPNSLYGIGVTTHNTAQSQVSRKPRLNVGNFNINVMNPSNRYEESIYLGKINPENRLIKLTNEIEKVLKPEIEISTLNPSRPGGYTKTAKQETMVPKLADKQRNGRFKHADENAKYATLAYDMLPDDVIGFQDFRDTVKSENPESKKWLGDNDKYSDKNPVLTFGMSNPGVPGDDKSDYKKSLNSDELNLLDVNKEFGKRDFIDFWFRSADKSEIIVFRATLGSISDSFSPTWDSYQMLGRADSLYQYKSFERTISFTFKVPAYSRAELVKNYKRLNALSGYTLPEYTEKGMKGPLMRLTIGDYLKEEPGFISSLNYDIDDDTPWEISLEGDRLEAPQIPHVIQVSASYTIIHQNLPTIKGKYFSLDAINYGSR